MRALHLYFRLHRPYELNPPSSFDKGYFGGEAEFREANRLEYQPFFALLERNTQRYENLKLSLSVSGIWLEQALKWDPELIRRLRRLVQNGCVEILASPFDYSLASFYSLDEFGSQIAEFKDRAGQLIGAECRVLAMPELIYHDRIGEWAREAEMSGVLIGAAEVALDYHTPNRVYEISSSAEFSLDDIFSSAPAPKPSARKSEPGAPKNIIINSSALAPLTQPHDTLLLCQNTRFSRAILAKGELATAVKKKAKEDFNDDEPEIPDPNVLGGVSRSPLRARRVATAAEFVKGMTAATSHKKISMKPTPVLRRRETPTERVFSAPKFQKELELESLRGEVINLCLDTAIFRAYQNHGIVRFFDELFGGWLKTSNHSFVTASEALELAPEHPVKLSVKSTIDWRVRNGHTDQNERSAQSDKTISLKNDSQTKTHPQDKPASKNRQDEEPTAADATASLPALLRDMLYCPPDWLRTPRQVQTERTLYSLRPSVLKTKKAELYETFSRLTDLSYLIPLNPESPALIPGYNAQKAEGWSNEDELSRAEYAERLATVIQSFQDQIDAALPRPPKLPASTATNPTAKPAPGSASSPTPSATTGSAPGSAPGSTPCVASVSTTSPEPAAPAESSNPVTVSSDEDFSVKVNRIARQRPSSQSSSSQHPSAQRRRTAPASTAPASSKTGISPTKTALASAKIASSPTKSAADTPPNIDQDSEDDFSVKITLGRKRPSKQNPSEPTNRSAPSVKRPITVKVSTPDMEIPSSGAAAAPGTKPSPSTRKPLVSSLKPSVSSSPNHKPSDSPSPDSSRLASSKVARPSRQSQPKTSPKISPKTSPKTSPKSSPETPPKTPPKTPRPIRKIAIEDADDWDEIVWSEDFNDEIQDEIEAEVQAIASRLSRQHERITKHINELEEAEIVD